MKKIFARIKVWFLLEFSDPLVELKRLLPELRRFRGDLGRLGLRMDHHSMGDGGIREIVNFFNIVSFWYDRREEFYSIMQKLEKLNVDGRFVQLITNIDLLHVHICNAGRCEYGWNRTTAGEIVTEDKVFLGNIFGLFTHPVSYWKQGKDEKKGGWGFTNMEHLNAYDVVSSQAENFIHSHLDMIVELVNKLDAECRDKKLLGKFVPNYQCP